MSEVIVNNRVKLVVKQRKSAIFRIHENSVAPSEFVHNAELIGSSFRSTGGYVTGLTLEEERRFLPSIIGVSVNDPGWDAAVKAYYQNLSVPVPLITGLVLEAGYIYPDEKSAEAGQKEQESEWQKHVRIRETEARHYNMSFSTRNAKGNPISLSDYILYRYCLEYGDVANRPEDAYNTNKIRFVMSSEEAERKTREIALSSKKKATSHFLSLVAEKPQDLLDIVAVLELPEVRHEKDALALEDFMYNWVQNNPEAYLNVALDAKLKSKATISRAIDHGVLRRIPNTSVIMYDDIELGKNMNEAISFLNADLNKELKATILGQLNATK